MTAAPVELRVATLNVWGLMEPLSRDVAHRLAAITDEIDAIDADLLAFEERNTHTLDPFRLEQNKRADYPIVTDDVVIKVFGRELSMGKGAGLMGILALVRAEARRRLEHK